MNVNYLLAARIKELYDYNEKTGAFVRKIATCNRVKIGDVAGSKHCCGYIHLAIDKKRYLAHRMAFLYVYGKIPNDIIDHINGIRDDNRICNLRAVSKSENGQNRSGAQSNNKTGLLGVHVDKRNGRFVSEIRTNGKSKYIGSFQTQKEAHDAYMVEKRRSHTMGAMT